MNFFWCKIILKTYSEPPYMLKYLFANFEKAILRFQLRSIDKNQLLTIKKKWRRKKQLNQEIKTSLKKYLQDDNSLGVVIKELALWIM